MDKDKLALNLTDSADVEITPEYADMDRLALSEPLEFIAKYNTPKEWILEQEEAEKIKAISAPANLVGGVGEKIQYGVGEALYNIGRSPSELAQLGTGIVSGAGKVLFPHSTDTALDRLYKNIALENAKNRDEREKIVTAFTGGDSDWVNWVSGLTELGLMVGGGVGAASIGASAARRGVEKLATTTAKGVAMSPSKVRRAASIAAAKGARSGQIASTIGLTFAQEGGSAATEKVREYIAKTGDTGLTNYDPLEDSVMSLAVGAINSAIEVGFGVERFIPEFWGTSTNFNRAARRFLEGAAGEGLEEFTQNITTQLSDIISGYKNDIDWGEAWNNAIMGAVLGGAAGSGMYYINRRRMANRIANDYGMDYKKAASLVDDMLGTGIESTTNELSARSELANERGSAWERMITGVKTAMGTVDFGTEESRENQAKAFARTNASIAMRFAQQSGLSTDEFLDVAEFETMNNGQNLNMVFIKPLGSVQDIDNRIKAQDEIINRQKELKKTGAADNDVLNLARQRKAILQKAKAIKQYNDKEYQEQIKANTTPETAQEIETATKDVESVKGATQAEFDSKVDTENLTSTEKSKRYGNAVLKSILPTKTDFDAVMVDPMYANAKQAIIAVADRINSFIKAHRTYGLKTDIANALKKMQTVNQGNFIDSVTTPDLDGVDVIAENAFLYHFLFSDATTIQTYLDSYITRAEDSLNQKKGKLSKKDLVGQSFKATDNAMQTQAQVIGAEYTSIYNEDGSYADKNVMAVMLSYQNQFVSDQTLKQADKIEDKLVVTHGVRLGDMEKALELGGLAAPSIAISKISEPLSDFGQIKLVGTKETIDPTNRANKVYDRDIWSQTFPRPEYKKAKISAKNKFRDKFRKSFIKAGEEDLLLDNILYLAVNSENPGQIVQRFSDSYGAQLYYIENVLGDTVDVPLQDKYDLSGIYYLKPDQQFLDIVSSIDINESYDVWENKYKKAIMDLIERGGIQDQYKNRDNYDKLLSHVKEYYSELRFGPAVAQIKEIHNYINNNGKEVDRYALQQYLDEKYGLFYDEKYNKWVNEQIKDLLGEPRVKVGRRLLEWNLENITKAMIQGATVGSENIGAGVGKVIAAGANRLGSIEEIRQEGQKLKTKEASDITTDEIGTRISNFAQDVLNLGYGEFDRENVYKALIKIASMPTPTESSLQRALSNALEDQTTQFDTELLKEGVEIAKEVQKLSRYYFEAKPQRAVSFDEFVGAVIPTDSVYDNVAAKLSERGLKVVRTDNLQNGILDLEQSVGNVLFQGKKANGFYDPELGVIVLGRNMNEMTLPHEMQHYWLDKIFNIYKRAKSGELQVRDEWMTETKALFDMLGIDENQTQLTQGQQEKFARMSEAYLTGIGVTGDMNATFKEYQQWVPEKYKSILNLGYLSDDGKIEYPFLDQGAVDFFNKWYANYSLPSLPTSPERQEFINPEDQNGEVLPVSIKEMNNRDKEFGNDSEEQVKTDQRLYNTLDENMPAEIKVEADGQKVVQASRSNFLKESEKQQRRWFERKSRDTEAQLAQDYIEKNPEHAKEVIFGDPELIPNDTGIDRATLINAYMALNNITPESEDWATLHTNIAINQSLAGTQLALSNNTSYRTYLDALREIENAREMKAATNYAGAKQGAVERFNRDIQRFVDEELPKVLATAPNTEARDIALKSLFERARTKFSGNTTGGVLNQMDFDYARGQKGASAAFTRWAVNQIKKDAGAKLNGQEQAHLLNLSAKAQQAVIDLDDRDIGKAVAGAQEIRKWQVEKDKLMGVKPQKFSLFGDYAPRAMLASFNTLVVSNIPSTAMNTAVVRMLESGILGKNEVSKSLTDSEIKRIKAIYGATAMNLAQMEKPTSPSLLHGEKYSSSGQKWYDPFTILGKEDNWFRVPTFVNTLARIATQDAKATGKSADDVFKEYCRLENQSDAAKLARKQALAVSNMAVFTQDGALARSLNGIRDWINQGSRALIGLDPKGFGLGNLLSPFLKTGANIAEMGIRGSLAPITTISALAQKWRSGKAIDPMKKLALAMDWTYFLLSSVMVALLAALTSDDDEFYSEPYEMGKAYDPDRPYDSINIAGVWIDLDFFGPFAIPIRTGCRLVQQWKKDNLSAIYKGYGQGLKYAAMDTPLLESVFNNQMSYAAKKPEDWATGYLYTQANKLVPSQIKPLSRAISRGTETQLDMGWSGKVIDRKFHRNYGFDGAELTTQDLIDIFTTKITWQPKE